MFPLKDDNPTTIFPIVTWAIIAINVTVFLYQIFYHDIRFNIPFHSI